jgi:hypothetical protein
MCISFLLVLAKMSTKIKTIQFKMLQIRVRTGAQKFELGFA